MSLTDYPLSQSEQIRILRDHLADRERKIVIHVNEATQKDEVIADLCRQNHDLVVANNAYLQRARDAEFAVSEADKTIDFMRDLVEDSRNENAAQAVLFEREKDQVRILEEENGKLHEELDQVTRHKNVLDAQLIHLRGVNDLVGDVEAFHQGCGTVDPQRPSIPDVAKRDLRIKLIKEEVHETVMAMLDGDMVEIADGLADIVYVCIGAALSYGIPFYSVWREVQRSNMAKFVDGKVIRRADNKILKPEGWTPPDIASVLKNARWDQDSVEFELVDA